MKSFQMMLQQASRARAPDRDFLGQELLHGLDLAVALGALEPSFFIASSRACGSCATCFLHWLYGVSWYAASEQKTNELSTVLLLVDIGPSLHDFLPRQSMHAMSCEFGPQTLHGFRSVLTATYNSSCLCLGCRVYYGPYNSDSATINGKHAGVSLNSQT